MFYEAFLAGIWASVGSTLGKLTGSQIIVGESYIIWGCLLVTMVLANTWGCRYYLRSLDAASNSVAPTVISAASSYVLSGESYIIWGCLLVTMVLANTWGCRYYLRSLDAASNSVAPTVISAASSYVLSGVIGIFLFEENSSVRWWAGAILIIIGLTLTARPRTKHKKEEQKNRVL